MSTPVIDIYPYNHDANTWAFCYLHGDAEDVFEAGDYAPDLFTAGVSMPTEPGSYPCVLDGHPAVAVIGMHHGRLGGRIALVTDAVALKHALDVDSWR